eukprot:4717935-Alexandrium_andersonii.AAC.1
MGEEGRRLAASLGRASRGRNAAAHPDATRAADIAALAGTRRGTAGIEEEVADASAMDPGCDEELDYSGESS